MAYGLRRPAGMSVKAGVQEVGRVGGSVRDPHTLRGT